MFCIIHSECQQVRKQNDLAAVCLETAQDLQIGTNLFAGKPSDRLHSIYHGMHFISL